MASDYQAMSYTGTVAASRAGSRSIQWSRVIPLMLLVPIIFAFGTPVLAMALLAVVLAAPVLVAILGVAAVRHDRSAG